MVLNALIDVEMLRHYTPVSTISHDFKPLIINNETEKEYVVAFHEKHNVDLNVTFVYCLIHRA